MKLDIPTFKTEKELLNFIVDNEDVIIAQKKSELKKADGFSCYTFHVKDINSNKSTPNELLNKDELKVKAVINTTNLLDSHKDVHIPGIWDKSLSENRRLLHVQEHKSNQFDKIISSGNDLKAYVETVSWKSLGYDKEGSTQALTFDSNVKKSRNPYMHEMYAKGFVDNHSVGMIYVKLLTCINDDDYPVQKENWDKYAPMVVNQDALERTKYFWAVLEAKCIEGSAVPNGSNFVTPTTSIKSEADLESEAKIEAIKKFLNM